MGSVLPDIPRVYTAVAEWIACLVFILMLKKRYKNHVVIMISVVALIAQMVFLRVTENVPLIFWIPCMIIAIMLMMLYIYLCCDIPYLDAAYFGIIAFVIAEFTASLEWQIIFFCWPNETDALDLMGAMVFFAVYGGVNFILWGVLSKHMPKDGVMNIKLRECLVALIIGTAVFAISNLSFLSVQTPFSSQYAREIANIRTLVGFAGVAMLCAHLMQCSEVRVRRELEAVQNVLQNQYKQYKQSRESIDLINYKYHDLKHQIAILRSEQDPEKRNEFLNKMEEEIKQYELQNKTGNKVLDTVLTSKSLYCDKHGITLTSVADGSLLDFMDIMDICSIFGNALDNAIECELKISDKEKRLIHVTVSQQKRFLMIRFENYYEGTLDAKEGLFATTKKEKQFHGYGLKSIQYTANKYEGAVNIDTKNNWFDLKVLIPLPEKKSI
ncbi:MAG: ATP-binding protein [Clostridiales bacterium]|nr:GHKL domain-containing protein [Roseburia sp.]MDD7636666.1 ATP-binding protein [Clostridiales bacterium]MDY4111647.1 ATP-binding protein [Roseburia sp.]